MKRLVLILAIVLLPGMAQAQDRPVLSGEHGSFTRLSVPIPPGAQWTLDDTEDGYLIGVDAAFDYDLDQVFERIGRERIAGVRQTDAGLRIDLACDCSASTFLFRDRFVVVDIDDTPRTRRPVVRDVARPLTSPKKTADFTLPLVFGIEGPAVVQGLRDTSPGDASRTDPVAVDLRDAQRQLSDALREVAGNDLLVNRDTAELVSAPALAPPDPHEGAPVPIGARTDLPGLAFRSGSTLGVTAETQAPDSVCWPADYTDVASWVPDGASISDVLSERRAVLTDTVGATDPTALSALAGAYIHFGFGAEAIHTLELDDSESRARQALRALAQITDDSGTGEVLSTQAGCPGQVALWVYLSGPDAAPPPSDIALTFKNLPAGLQLALGGRLAVRLATDGRAEDADQVLRTLAAADSPIQVQRLHEIEVSLAQDAGPVTLARIEASLAAESGLPAEILITLAERAHSAGITPPPGLIAQLEDQIFVARDTPLVPPLRSALVRAYTAAGRFMDAFDDAQPTQTPVPDALIDLRSEVVMAAAAKAETATVLKIAFDPQARATNADAQNAMARRLLDLGFPEEARRFLDEPAQGGTMGQRRYLRAEAEVALGDSVRAAEILAGITTPRAEAILSGTDWSVLREDASARAALAWRQSDWTELVQSGDETLQDLAALATRDSPQTSQSALVTSGREIVEEAATARVTLEQGLNRFAPPTE